MRKAIIALGLVAVVLVGATYVYAQSLGHGRMGWGYGKWSSLTNEQRTRSQERGQRFSDETAQLIGPGWGMGPVFGHGHMMDNGYGRGRGYGMGSGHRMGPVNGMYY
jgi:hypothetical protein